MVPKTTSTAHNVIFSVLVALVLCEVGATFLHLSSFVTNLIILSIAFLITGLVVAQYMGLRIEGPVVIGLVLIPVLLFAILTFVLIDIRDDSGYHSSTHPVPQGSSQKL